jgi:hypothetical protein
VLSGSLPPGAVLRSAMKRPASPRGTKSEILEAVDRQLRKACPWLRTGGVVDHQVIDVFVGDAGLGKDLRAGDAESAGGVFLSSPPRKRGSRATIESLRPWVPAFAGMTADG